VCTSEEHDDDGEPANDWSDGQQRSRATNGNTDGSARSPHSAADERARDSDRDSGGAEAAGPCAEGAFEAEAATESKTAPAPLSTPLAIGRRVAVHGLTGRVALNGQLGTVVAFSSESGRYAVCIDGVADDRVQPSASSVPAGTQVAIRLENLSRVACVLR
jgi:hypothetical protein